MDGQDPQRIPYDPKASLSEQVAQSFKLSLKNLQTTYLDWLVLHSPMTSLKLTLEVWKAMEQLAKSGDINQLGISNCYELDTLEALYQSAEIKPTIIQNRFYANTGYDRAIRAYCKENGIIYQSFWTLTGNAHVLADYSILKHGDKIRTQSSPGVFQVFDPNRDCPFDWDNFSNPYAGRFGDLRF